MSYDPIRVWVSFIKKLTQSNVNFDDFGEDTDWNAIIKQFEFNSIEAGLILNRIKDPYNFEFTLEVLKCYKKYSVTRWDKKYYIHDFNDLITGVDYFTNEKAILDNEDDVEIVSVLLFLMALNKKRDQNNAGQITLYKILQFGDLE